MDRAVAEVQRWLDRGSGAVWVRRENAGRHGLVGTWTLDLQHDELPVRSVRIVVSKNFPAIPCELYVDPQYFLKLPHIEVDGHVCLGHEPLPSDYDDPISAVTRALQTLKDKLLIPARDPAWVAQQFNAERDSYWTQMCLSRRLKSSHHPVAARTYIDIGELDRWSTTALVSYVQNEKVRRFTRQIAVLGDVDPHVVATRHGWACGTVVRGDALFVRLPANAQWVPSDWPMTFASLDAAVAHATGGGVSLSGWLKETGWSETPVLASKKQKRRRALRNSPSGQRPRLVVLVQDAAAFGYQIFAPLMPGLTAPHVEPLSATRIDPDWALARDHQLEVLRARRAKRVLLLGCGSLGSPLVKALARAGVGQLDVLDAQIMEAENTARHELGIDDIEQAKAPALAERMRKEVPGLAIRGFAGKVELWCATHCRPGDYDLVIECTGESSVRTYLSHMRTGLFGACPLVHTWTEPLCSAGHVILTQPSVPWPPDDPADTLVNASDLSAEDTRVHVPACAGGFHPYGAADIELVAAFAAERIIGVLDDLHQPSTVWSWVRATGFFEQLHVAVTPRAIVPVSPSKWDSSMLTRELAAVLGDI